MVLVNEVIIMIQFPVILEFDCFLFSKSEGLKEPVITRLKTFCHFCQVDRLSTEICGICAHPCFNAAWKFYFRVWYMQFRPQTMVSEKYCFESEGFGNLERKCSKL